MRVTSVLLLTLVAIPIGLIAFNGILIQIGLNPIDYGSWQIWVLSVCIVALSFKVTFK